MTTLVQLEDIEDDLAIVDTDFGIKDRGEMYLRVHALTNSSSSVVEGNISTFSGFVGGTAFMANYILADRSRSSDTDYPNYSMVNINNTNDIFEMSQAVANGYITSVLNDFNNTIDGHSGELDIAAGIASALNIWIGEDYPDQFPGNIFNMVDIGTISIPSPDTSDGKMAGFYGSMGSILFGKSVEDFQGRSGYATINGPDISNSDFYGINRYVVHVDLANVGATSMVNGDRDDDGLITYEDGVVVMIDTDTFDVAGTTWESLVEANLATYGALYSGVTGINTDLNWDDYRDWNLIKDFRVQLVEGGEYDFEEYAKDFGVGDQKDFWAYAEGLLEDTSAVVRNLIYYYDRTDVADAAGDYLYGGAGEDVLVGDAGNDVIRSGWNSDDLYGYGGVDYLYGEAGNDNLYGGLGDDHLYGGAGVDYVYGGDGDDTLYGYGDSSSLDGDYYFGGDGVDTLDYSAVEEENIIEINLSAGTARYRSSSGPTGNIDTFSGIEKIITGSSDTTVYADSANNIIENSGGFDQVYDLGGSDTYIINLDGLGDSQYHGFQSNIYETLETGANDVLYIQTSSSIDDFNINVTHHGSLLNISIGQYSIVSGVAQYKRFATVNINKTDLGVYPGEYENGLETLVINQQSYSVQSLLQTDIDREAYLKSSFSNGDFYHDNLDDVTKAIGVGAFGTSMSNGIITAVKTDPALGLNWISSSRGSETLHPWVVSGFTGGAGYSEMTFSTYVKEIALNSAVSLDDIHINANGNNSGSAELLITIGSLFSFTIPDFETGKFMSGLGKMNATLYDSIAEASSSTLQKTGMGTYQGTYDTEIDFTSGSFSETYFFEALDYGNGVIDMTGTITFNGTSNNDALYGLNTRGDILKGNEGSDYLYSYGGDDTLIGGAGGDYLYGGVGDDIYEFDLNHGSDNVSENISEGNDTIRLLNVDTDDIRLYTNSSGHLILENKNDASNKITISASYEGSYESTIRDYVEQVVFDDETVWDLTGGLTLEGTSSNDNLYGTKFNDTLLGLGGTDYLYGNTGDDTLIGGAGDDTLYGGVGDDIYEFDLNHGSDNVSENIGEGNETIRLLNVDAEDIRLYTNSSGNLILENKSDPSNKVTISASYEGSYESTIRDYVEQVVFDDETIWDLTGALTLEGTSSNDSLYGTKFDDTLLGLGGTDYLYGNTGDDTLIGGAGDDYLYGGVGNDTYIFDLNHGSDYVNDYVGEGNDTIRLQNVDADDIRLYTDAAGSLILQNKNDISSKVTIYAGTESAQQSTIRDYVEQVVFDDETVWDLSGALTLEGSSSGDTLYGTKFNDTLLGLDGTDHLFGNTGDDTLIGGAGDDYLYGGDGADNFVFNTAALGSIDYIYDFSLVQGDKIDISQLLFGYDPLTSLIDDFVSFSAYAGHTNVTIDRDGTGTTYSSQSIATIINVTGLDADTMLTNGNLIAA